jgi:RNA polymerase sigma-70 factor, ECF subfamily
MLRPRPGQSPGAETPLPYLRVKYPTARRFDRSLATLYPLRPRAALLGDPLVTYPEHSVEKRLLDNDREALGQVIRWIALALTSPRYWSLRPEWPDLVQEVLARVVESLRQGRFDASRDLRLYVQGVARYVCLQALADRRAEVRPVGNPGGNPHAGGSSPESRMIDLQLVRRVLDFSSEDCRGLFRLYFFEGRSYEEIAMGLGLPVGTVKSRLFRCLESASVALGDSRSRNRKTFIS